MGIKTKSVDYPMSDFIRDEVYALAKFEFESRQPGFWKTRFTKYYGAYKKKGVPKYVWSSFTKIPVEVNYSKFRKIMSNGKRK
jgi:hypothetical protein